jgi:MFS family permease
MGPVQHLPFFLASFVWNYALGMTWLAVPLYAHDLGLGAAQIGTLFSLPVVAQIVLNIVGGAYVDRLGGRRIMLASSLLMGIAAIEFVFARGFWGLFAGQLLMVVTRAAFWPANWSIATLLPGARGVQVGRLNAVTNLGQIVGNGSCGFILASAGFQASFSVMAAMGFAAWALGLATPRSAHRAGPSGGLFSSYGTLLRMPIQYYLVACSYLSALPFSLSATFYPLLLQHLGYAEEPSGVLIALRAVGGVGAGLVIARFVRSGPASPWPVIAGLLVALAVGLMPMLEHWSALGACLLAAGIGSGIMTVFFQVTIGETVGVQMRGSAMAIGGFGWGISHFTTPLVMGLLAERLGIQAGFYALGALALATVAAIALLRRWAFSGARLAP